MDFQSAKHLDDALQRYPLRSVLRCAVGTLNVLLLSLIAWAVVTFVFPPG